MSQAATVHDLCTKKRVKPRKYEQQPREKNEEEITPCISLEGDVLSLQYPPTKKQPSNTTSKRKTNDLLMYVVL